MENKEITTSDILAKFSQKKHRKPTVCYPAELVESNMCALWGFYHTESNYYNITHTTILPSMDIEKMDGKVLMKESLKDGLEIKKYPTNKGCSFLGVYYGKVECTPSHFVPDKLTGYTIGDEIVFYVDEPRQVDPLQFVQNEVLCDVEAYKLKMDIFSRNTGILESDTMLKKGAVIIGCGSVGSLVALELARAGVGRFFLIDMDIMSYHNICRHQCGVRDVGKFKTTAVKERILQINPTAEVHTENKMIQEIALSEFEEFCNEDCIMVGCADNREGDLYADAMIAKPYKMPFVSIGCWERAFAGEVFYCLPEGMPAYSDFVAALGESSGRTTANTHLYMGEVGTFEPGISVDINFVTTIAVKLILDLLNRNNENYTQRLINSLTQYTLICNTNNPKIGGEMAEIFSYPLQVTRSIKVEYANK